MKYANKIYHDLLLIVMMYMSVDLASMVFAYKIVTIGPIIGAASSIIFPLTYSIMDIVAEVYGFQMAKRIIWYAFTCDFIFAILVLIICQIPSANQSESISYTKVLGSLSRAVIAQSIGILSGAFINIYFISKWKIMTKGRYFWLRSIGSSTIGEAVMLIISAFIALIGTLPIQKLFQLIIYTYIYKIIFAIGAAPFISLIATKLKARIGNKEISFINFLHKSNTADFSPMFQKL